MSRISMQSTWPGLSGSAAVNFGRIGAQLPTEDPNVWLVQPVDYFNVKQFVAGATASPVELSFFDEGEIDHVCNLPKPAAVSTERPFWLTGISVSIFPGTRTVNALASTIGQAINSTGAGTPPIADIYTLAGITADLINFGSMTLRVNDTPVFPAKPISRLPAGGGLNVQGFSTDTTATIARIAAGFQNGEPATFNVYTLRTWFPILPDQKIDCKIRMPFSRTGAASTGLLVRVSLIGEGMISRAG